MYYRICVSGLSMHGFNQITDRNLINCMYNLNNLFVIFTYKSLYLKGYNINDFHWFIKMAFKSLIKSYFHSV